jgi:hypothetical protein
MTSNKGWIKFIRAPKDLNLVIGKISVRKNAYKTKQQKMNQ